MPALNSKKSMKELGQQAAANLKRIVPALPAGSSKAAATPDNAPGANAEQQLKEKIKGLLQQARKTEDGTYKPEQASLKNVKIEYHETPSEMRRLAVSFRSEWPTSFSNQTKKIPYHRDCQILFWWPAPKARGDRLAHVLIQILAPYSPGDSSVFAEHLFKFIDRAAWYIQRTEKIDTAVLALHAIYGEDKQLHKKAKDCLTAVLGTAWQPVHADIVPKSLCDNHGSQRCHSAQVDQTGCPPLRLPGAKYCGPCHLHEGDSTSTTIQTPMQGASWSLFWVVDETIESHRRVAHIAKKEQLKRTPLADALYKRYLASHQAKDEAEYQEVMNSVSQMGQVKTKCEEWALQEAKNVLYLLYGIGEPKASPSSQTAAGKGKAKDTAYAGQTANARWEAETGEMSDVTFRRSIDSLQEKYGGQLNPRRSDEAD